SFGIHVARLAGMPRVVVDRAGEILKKLESERDGDGESERKGFKKVEQKREGAVQLSLFQLDDPLVMSIRDEIIGLDIDNLTPREALNKLYDIRRLLGLDQAGGQSRNK
ncbi:MAG: DNA mismatch repair protein MutS, partial [Bacteroidales bacterium]|nr:DNA mismatch repair protein MutS [Bacteroidales bacterium]